MKRRIVAIGGGKILCPKGQAETLDIDRSIIEMSGRQCPRVLFIPTASGDNREYCEAFQQHYNGYLGCTVDTLLLYRDPQAMRRAASAIAAADVIYVGGGNTLRMMRLWRRRGIDVLLDQARRRGTVLSGTSAGAICWFRQGNSDSRKFSNPDDQTLIKVRGLDYVDLLLCPHYDAEAHRQPALKIMMKKTAGIAVALDNGAALQIDNDRFRILSSLPGARAYRVCWQRDDYQRHLLAAQSDWQSLAHLLDKSSLPPGTLDSGQGSLSGY